MSAETHASILSLPDLVNGHASLVRRGRYLTATFLVEAGDTEFLVRVVEGRIAGVEAGPVPHALLDLRPARLRGGLGALLGAGARAGLPRPPGHGEARGRADAGRARCLQIDTTRCPLYLLTGEYDFSCTPEDTRLTAEKIPGAHFTLMTEIGHFPMAENPAQFRRYLLPVLDEIRAAAR